MYVSCSSEPFGTFVDGGNDESQYYWFSCIGLNSNMLPRLRISPACASWRRMLVLAPHAAPLYVIGSENHPGIAEKSICHGLRMEDLVRLRNKIRDFELKSDC